MHACVPSEASRKCQSVSAGKPFGTSWTPGRMRAAAVTSSDVDGEPEQPDA